MPLVEFALVAIEKRELIMIVIEHEPRSKNNKETLTPCLCGCVTCCGSVWTESKRAPPGPKKYVMSERNKLKICRKRDRHYKRDLQPGVDW